MDTRRRPFQGVLNILRFNWPFFALAAAGWVTLVLLAQQVPSGLRTMLLVLVFLSAAATLLSLVVSWYVYDASGLYQLRWLERARITTGSRVLNINAGFDETSALLQARFQPAQLTVWDFYNPQRHTEASIRRARAAYPPYPGTLAVNTARLPQGGPFDRILLVFAAHEIRDDAERAAFFGSLRKQLAAGGLIVVTEHLRDAANVGAYHLGAGHFLPLAAWRRTFSDAGLRVAERYRVNPFVTTFLLEHDPAS
jgi:SAM-dependent methyltransferase